MKRKNRDYDLFEEGIIKAEIRKKKNKMKVSGKSIFKLQGIIKRKSQISKSK